MTDPIADSAVALSLMLQAVSLLDAPEHAGVAAYLRSAIGELSPGEPLDPSYPTGAESKWVSDA